MGRDRMGWDSAVIGQHWSTSPRQVRSASTFVNISQYFQIVGVGCHGQEHQAFVYSETVTMKRVQKHCQQGMIRIVVPMVAVVVVREGQKAYLGQRADASATIRLQFL